ncbi:hypothetical protein [Microbacterium paraoxydans]|uniref:hypothetical protein n=1 Tax=Microbacterium paraoxydans TaxID=199592 RepID=UPI000469DF57|nr:hypothetical protein [Microbacterium paraoxydans]
MGGTLTKVDIGHGRGWLEAEAAKSQARIDRALGHPQQITEAGRSWEQQNEHWEHYLKYGAPIALHPDTPSVHQMGRAKDTDERDVALMNDHGWYQTVYRLLNGRRTLVEPWHFEYDPARDNHRNDPAPSGAGSTALTFEEDEDMRVIVSNGNYYAIAKQYLSHLNDKTQAAEAEALYGKARELGNGDASTKAGAKLRAQLDLHGVPRSVLDGNGRVLNPQSGKFEANGTWSREREILARSASAKS